MFELIPDLEDWNWLFEKVRQQDLALSALEHRLSAVEKRVTHQETTEAEILQLCDRIRRIRQEA